MNPVDLRGINQIYRLYLIWYYEGKLKNNQRGGMKLVSISAVRLVIIVMVVLGLLLKIFLHKLYKPWSSRTEGLHRNLI